LWHHRVEDDALNILDLHSSDIQTEDGLSQALQTISSQSRGKSLITVEAIGKTEKHLLEAGDRSAAQDLVLASTLAEGIRTFHIQFAAQLTSTSVWAETQHLISGLFEELSSLLQGVHLIGELSPQGRMILLSFGERAAALITAQSLKERSLEAQSVVGRTFFLALTDLTPEETRSQIAADFRTELDGLIGSSAIPVIPASLRSLWSGD